MPTELLRASGTSDNDQEVAQDTTLNGSEGIEDQSGTDSDGEAAKPGTTKLPERPIMAFDRGSVSAEAKSLVAELVGLIETREQELGKRVRARSKQVQNDLIKLIGRFAGELVAAVDRDTLPLLPCHKNVNRLSKQGISHRLFDPVFEGLQGLGLIRTAVRGSWQRIPEFGPRVGIGKATRIQPTQALLELVRRHGIKPHTASRHFPRLIPPSPVRLRASSTWVYGEKLRGRLMSVPKTIATDRLKADVQELNAFIGTVKIEGVDGIELTGWTRIFNQGDHEDFAWNRGGRLYGQPSDANYQSRSSAERGQLRLDGEAVVEIDVRASHLHIVYALRGQSLAQHVREFDEKGQFEEVDPYRVGDLPREVVKAWVTITLGAGAPPEKWPKEATRTLKEDRGINLKSYPPAKVGQAVLNRHPVLRGLSGISWARLQFIESQAIVATMLQLMRDHHIPALPVHDSLIVPRSAYHVADYLLEEEIKSVTGQLPLPLKPSIPRTDLPEPKDTPHWDFLRENLWDF